MQDAVQHWRSRLSENSAKVHVPSPGDNIAAFHGLGARSPSTRLVRLVGKPETCRSLLSTHSICKSKHVFDSVVTPDTPSIEIPISHMPCRASRRPLTDWLSVPRSVLKELQEHARQIEEIIATLEELTDQEGIRRIRSSLKQYEQGEYAVLENPKEMESLFGD